MERYRSGVRSTFSENLRMRLVMLALLSSTVACAARTAPVPTDTDPRWVPSTTNPAIARIDLLGTPSAAGEFRYLLRVPAGFQLATHRHNTDLLAVLQRGEQRVVIENADGTTREHVLKPGDRLLIPKGVPHRESWREASVVHITGTGPMVTTTP
jgi:mannose-6-phosphate isomerase-like protein (cupin superfamily)